MEVPRSDKQTSSYLDAEPDMLCGTATEVPRVTLPETVDSDDVPSTSNTCDITSPSLSPRPAMATSYYTLFSSISLPSAPPTGLHSMFESSRYTLLSNASFSHVGVLPQKERTSSLQHRPPHNNSIININNINLTSISPARGKAPDRSVYQSQQLLPAPIFIKTSPPSSPVDTDLPPGGPHQKALMEDASPFTVNGLPVAHLPRYILTRAQYKHKSVGRNRAEEISPSLVSSQTTFPSSLSPSKAAATLGAKAAPEDEDAADTFTLSSRTDEMYAFFGFPVDGPAETSDSHLTISGTSEGGSALHDNPMPTAKLNAASTVAEKEFSGIFGSCCGLSRSDGTCTPQSVIDSSAAKLFVRDGSRRQHF